MNSVAINVQYKPEILTLFLKRSRDGAVSPVSISFNGDRTRVLYGFAPGATLAETLEPGFAALVGSLAARADARAALKLPETDLHSHGVRLQGCHIVVGAPIAGAEPVTIRFERCSGDARRLLLREALPALGRAERRDDPDAKLLRDMLIPLFNLRSYLEEAQPGAGGDGPVDAFLRGVAQRIGDLQNRYMDYLDATVGADAGATGPGLMAALAVVARDSRRAPSCQDCLAAQGMLARIAA